MLDNDSVEGILWCKEQVDHQGGSRKEIANMVRAWRYACWEETLDHDRLDKVFNLHHLVKPYESPFYRETPVTFANGSFGLAPDLIPRAMQNLAERMGESFVGLELYEEFEKIHPFNDGNGRVGALIYNMLIGKINTPVHVPFLFKGEPALASDLRATTAQRLVF